MELTKQVVSDKGVVACGNRIEADAGIEVLRSGGNAVDAAVCMAFTGCVIEHRANGLGGYASIIMLYQADTNQVICVDANGYASELAYPDMFETLPGETAEWAPVKNKENHDGPRSVIVPGTVAGLGLTAERYGTRPLPELLEPAEHYARNGFPLYDFITDGIRSLEPIMRRYPGSTAVLYPNDVVPSVGDIFVQRDLAETIKTIATKGYRTFYEGEIAHTIADYISAEGGLLTYDDMASYQPLIIEPLRSPYRGAEVCAGPITTAGPSILEILKVMEHFELPQAGSVDHVRLLAEIMARVWKDRLKYCADPLVVPVDVEWMLSEAHAVELARDVAESLSPECCPVQGADGGTTHYIAADSSGNIAAITQTHGNAFGSRVVVPGTGCFMAHGMSRFNPLPGFANSIGPRKRPLHNMGPTLLMKNGKAWASTGTPGGRTIINSMPQIVSNMVDRKMNIYEAVAAPRVHRENGINLTLDTRLFESIGPELERCGYKIHQANTVSGPVHGIERLADGSWMGTSDPRHWGVTLGL